MKKDKRIIQMLLLVLILIIQITYLGKEFFTNIFSATDNLTIFFYFPLVFLSIVLSIYYFVNIKNVFFNKIFRVVLYVLLIISVYKFIDIFYIYYTFSKAFGFYWISLVKIVLPELLGAILVWVVLRYNKQITELNK